MLITQSYSDMSVRYNAETDYVQVHNGTGWVDWLLANVQWDGYLYKFGSGFYKDFIFSGGIEENGLWKVYAPGTEKNGQESQANITVVTSNKPIDVTKYSNVTMEFSYSGNNYYGSACNLGLSSNNDANNAMVRSIYSNNDGSNWSMGAKNVSIADLQGEYYIKFYIAVKGWDNKTLLIKNLYFA